MSFHVGMRVVCVGDFSAHYGVNIPRKGEVYTIRELEFRGNAPSLRLAELHNSPIEFRNVPGLVEPSFVTTGFRPLTETKSRISFVEGAPRDSEKFDNRRKVRERA